MSHRLPALKPKDVLRLRERERFDVHHVRGSHYVLKHPHRKHLRVTLPWHGKDLKRGTRILTRTRYCVTHNFRHFRLIPDLEVKQL